MRQWFLAGILAVVLVGCLLFFQSTLLADIPKDYWKDGIFLSMVFGLLYAFVLVILYRLVKSIWGRTTLHLVSFTLVFLIASFQIASEARADFGATWLPSEVFFELVVTKGNGLWILAMGLFFSTCLFLVLKRTPKNP